MEFLFYLSLMGILISITWYSWKYGISPTPTSYKVKNQIKQLLPSNIKQDIAELGSGWGTLAFFLAQHYPNNQVFAYEISLIPYIFSQIVASFLRYTNLQINHQDFFDVSLENCSLVVCYLYPEVMSRLKIKFEAELSQEAYVLTHTFAIPDWKPIQILKVNDLYHTPIYLYQVRNPK